jgi:lysozyme family protein
MANHKNIVPFFYRWEGGESNDPKDSASSYHCGVDKIHTVKGVTYKAWIGVFGKDEVERFLEMNHEDWGLIFKSKYWDAVKGDDIEHQSIADCLVSWAWGSGARTAVKQMQRVLGVTRDGIIGKNTLAAINEADEKELFAKCVEARRLFFHYIATPRNAKSQTARQRYTNNQRFLRGWLRRLEAFSKEYAPK